MDISYMMMSERIEWQIREACEEASAAARAETLAADAIAHVRSLRGFSIPEDKISEDLIANFHVDPDQVAEILERASRPEEDLVAT